MEETTPSFEEKSSFEETPSQNPGQPSEPLKTKTEEKNTGMAIVAYILFFIPLLTDAKKDPFVKYHVKQGLVIFLAWIVVSIVSWILPWQLSIIATLLDIGVFVLMILGIMNAAKGLQKPLPILGKLGEQFKF